MKDENTFLRPGIFPLAFKLVPHLPVIELALTFSDSFDYLTLVFTFTMDIDNFADSFGIPILEVTLNKNMVRLINLPRTLRNPLFVPVAMIIPILNLMLHKFEFMVGIIVFIFSFFFT